MTFATTWTSDDEQQLREAWPLGVPATEIGQRLNKSKNSVIGKAHRLHLEPRNKSNSYLPFDKSRFVAVQALIEAGYSQMEVEARTGVSKHRIQKARAEGDLPEYTRPKVALPTLPSLAGMSRPSATVQKPKTKPIPVARAKPVQQARPATDPARIPLIRIFRKPLNRTAVAPMTAAEAAQVAQFLALRGVTKCPAAAVAVTTATISASDRAAIAEHQMRVQEGWLESTAGMRDRAAKGGQAAARQWS